MKSKRDFTRTQPVHTGPSAATTSAKSGQLILSTQKKADSASGSQNRGHEQLNKKISRTRLGSRVLPNLVTRGGAELGLRAKFVKAWNDVDCPDGPSPTVDFLQGLEESLAELKGQLEVTATPCFSLTHVHHHASPPVPEIRVESLILLGGKKAIRLESPKNLNTSRAHNRVLAGLPVPESHFTLS